MQKLLSFASTERTFLIPNGSDLGNDCFDNCMLEIFPKLVSKRTNEFWGVKVAQFSTVCFLLWNVRFRNLPVIWLVWTHLQCIQRFFSVRRLLIVQYLSKYSNKLVLSHLITGRFELICHCSFTLLHYTTMNNELDLRNLVDWMHEQTRSDRTIILWIIHRLVRCTYTKCNVCFQRLYRLYRNVVFDVRE